MMAPSHQLLPGFVVGGPAPSGEAALRAGDLITIVAGHRLTDGLGGVPRPALGATVTFGIVRGADMGSVAVRVDRPNPYPLPT